jgi:hypothetical protein
MVVIMSNVFLIKYRDNGYLNGCYIECVEIDENDRLVVYTRNNLCFYVQEDCRDGFLNNLQVINENGINVQSEMSQNNQKV